MDKQNKGKTQQAPNPPLADSEEKKFSSTEGETTPDQEQDAGFLAKENYDRYLRAVAELENYKKRTAREKLEMLKFGNEALLRDLLPIYDALERAIEQIEGETVDRVGVKEGLEMLRDKLNGVMAKHGLEVIESLHKGFDPNFHEALLKRESNEFPHNTVVAELEKGFILNGRLLRPARVEVCQNTNDK